MTGEHGLERRAGVVAPQMHTGALQIKDPRTVLMKNSLIGWAERLFSIVAGTVPADAARRGRPEAATRREVCQRNDERVGRVIPRRAIVGGAHLVGREVEVWRRSTADRAEGQA